MAAENNNQLRATAGEYVLGTLDELDLRRFEALLHENAEARREVAYWEQRLGALALALDPVEPPDAVWARIAAKIGPRRSAPATSGSGRAGRTGIWQGIAMAASVAALVMAALLFTTEPPPSEPAPDARPALAGMIHDEPSGMSWLVTADAGGHEVDVVAMNDYDVPEGKILRAWIIPQGGQPIGLGTMPVTSGRQTMAVPAAVEDVIDKPMQWAVSLEDQSDADAEAPHGEVLWAVPIARRTG